MHTEIETTFINYAKRIYVFSMMSSKFMDGALAARNDIPENMNPYKIVSNHFDDYYWSWATGHTAYSIWAKRDGRRFFLEVKSLCIRGERRLIRNGLLY